MKTIEQLEAEVAEWQQKYAELKDKAHQNEVRLYRYSIKERDLIYTIKRLKQAIILIAGGDPEEDHRND